MMTNNNKWRLTADVYAIMNNCKKHIYLAATEKKAYVDPVKKMADALENLNCEVLRLEGNEFKIKITNPEDRYDGSCCVYIKSDLLPEKAWYKLKNYDETTLVDIFTSVSNDRGDFKDAEFEAIFQLDNSSVSFIHQDMSVYKECLEEFKRRINCELNAKTKKLIEGHRYDTPEETRYVLCFVKTRKVKPTNSEFTILEKDCQSGYLYVNEIPEGVNTVSDLLKMGVLESSVETMKSLTDRPIIRLSRTVNSMSDGGEALLNDYTGEISDYWNDLVHNSLEIIGTNLSDVDKFGTVVSSALDIISLYTPKKDDGIKSLVGEIIDCVTNQTLGIFWNRPSMYSIGPAHSEDDNVKGCRALVDSTIKDTNINKTEYNDKMFKYYGVDVYEHFGSVIKDFNERVKTFTSDFEMFVNNRNYFYLRRADTDWTFRQRVKSTNYKLDVVTLSSKLGENSELREAIIELANHAKSSSGNGVSEFFTYNVGSRKDPKVYVRQVITLENLIKFKKGEKNMSESLKNEIMSKCFVECLLEYDLEGTLE